jgi:hypothetical protein
VDFFTSLQRDAPSPSRKSARAALLGLVRLARVR